MVPMQDHPEIFIGIPCYNTGEKLLATLQSVQEQRFKNFKAVIAIEPTDDAERTIEIANFVAAQDHRFIVKINEAHLGWAGNIKQLMQEVDCPYFTILPHDDILHENYLLLLHTAILEHPDIIIAFPSFYYFGHCDGNQVCPDQPGSLYDRLTNHFTSGESPEFWKGLTRSSILNKDTVFPASSADSFAAEYEWAIVLLSQGRSLYVKEAYYYKRIYKSDVENSVSTEWSHKYNSEKLYHSLTEHKKRVSVLLKLLPLKKHELKSILFASNVAHIWKILHFTAGRFPLPKAESKQLAKINKKCSAKAELISSEVAQRASLCDLLNEYQLNNLDSIETQLLPIIEADPQNIDAQILLMKIYLRQNDLSKAMPQLNTLTVLFPNSWRIREVSIWLSDSLNNQFQYE